MRKTPTQGSFLCAGFSAGDRDLVEAARSAGIGTATIPDSMIGNFGRPFRDRDLGDVVCPRGQPVPLKDIPDRHPAVLVSTGIVVKPTGISLLREGVLWPACLLVDLAKDATIVRFFPADLEARPIDYTLAIRDPNEGIGRLTIEERAFLTRGPTFADLAAIRVVLGSYPDSSHHVPDDRRIVDGPRRVLKSEHLTLDRRVLAAPTSACYLGVGSPAVLETLPFVVRGTNMVRPAKDGDFNLTPLRICDRDDQRWPILWVPASTVCREIQDRPVSPSVSPTGALSGPTPVSVRAGAPAAQDRAQAPRGAIRPRAAAPALPDRRYRGLVRMFGPIAWYGLFVDRERIGYSIVIGSQEDPDQFDHGSWDRPLTYSDAETIFNRLQQQEEVPDWIADAPLETDRRREILNLEGTP